MSNTALEEELGLREEPSDLDAIQNPAETGDMAQDILGQDPDEEDELEAFAKQATAKVQLDIDDAEFLLDPAEEAPKEVVAQEEEAPPPAKTEEAPIEPEQAPKPVPRLLKISVAIFILVSLCALVWYMYFRPVEDHTKVPVPPTSIVVPSPEEETLTETGELLVPLLPFFIERRQGGNTRFLKVAFVLVAADADMQRDIFERTTILRDAIYYYLRNQDPDFVLNSKNIATIKSVLTDVVNGQLSTGKLEDFLIVEYVIR